MTWRIADTNSHDRYSIISSRAARRASGFGVSHPVDYLRTKVALECGDDGGKRDINVRRHAAGQNAASMASRQYPFLPRAGEVPRRSAAGGGRLEASVTPPSGASDAPPPPRTGE